MLLFNKKKIFIMMIICFLIIIDFPVQCNSLTISTIKQTDDHTYDNQIFEDHIHYKNMYIDPFTQEIKYMPNNQKNIENQEYILNTLKKVKNENKRYENPLGEIISSSGLMDSAWPMSCYNTFHSCQSPISTKGHNGWINWTYGPGSTTEGGIVIDKEGIIYFGAGFSIYAVYPDGSEKWQYSTDGAITSTPALGNDGTIYIGSWDNYLHAINPNGSLIWKIYLDGDISSSPAIAEDGTIYIGTYGRYNEHEGYINAINPNGSFLWQYETAGSHVVSDPAIGDDGTVYIGSGDSYFYAMNPDGTLKWRFKTGSIIKSQPSIDEDGVIYFDSFDGYLYALYPDGTLKWKTKSISAGNTCTAIGSDGTLYIAGAVLQAIDPLDGSIIWNTSLGSKRWVWLTTPAISNNGMIYLGVTIDQGVGGEIIAINTNGIEQWRKRIATDWIACSPAIGPDGTIYIGSASSFTDYSKIYAFGVGELNTAPETPVISGPTIGKPGTTYTYTIVTTDPQNDNIFYSIAWETGSTSWIGPISSGEPITVNISWNKQGTYSIYAYAKDEHGETANPGILEVTMPKNKEFLSSIMEWFFFRIFRLHSFNRTIK